MASDRDLGPNCGGLRPAPGRWTSTARARAAPHSLLDRPRGFQRWSTEVLADRVFFLGVAAKRTSEPTEQVEPPPPEDAPAGAEDDIPF